MVTTVADTLFSRLIDAFPADRAYGANDISRDPMPRPVREYLEQRVAQHLDEMIYPDDAWIHSEHPEVREAAGTYRSALSRHVRIPASSWRTELGLACRRVVSFLVRPAPTLADFVFADGKQEATVEELSQQLGFLPAYSYFSDVIGAYIEQKDLERISRERFAGLARRIDQQMVRDFGTDEWMKLLHPLLDVVRQIPEFSGGLPTELMKTFLEEKGAEDLVDRLEARFLSTGIRFMQRSDMRDLFERPLEEPAEEAAATESVEAPRSAERQRASHHGSHVPLWKQFESGLHTSPIPNRSASAASVSSGDAAPPGSADGQPLWKQFRGSEGPPPTGRTGPNREEPSKREGASHLEKHRQEPANERRVTSGPAGEADVLAKTDDDLSRLENAVLGRRGMRNRDLFLTHLFSGSSAAYEATLRKLDAAESWSEASQIIAREVFLKHQVNIYSDPAVAFTDAAEAKFRS